MKKLLLLLTLFSAFIFNACKKAIENPVACFTTNKSSVEIGETVNFESCAENAVKVEWDFGDGTTKEGTTVSHSYTESGTYVVQQKVYTEDDKKQGVNIDRFSTAITVKGYTRYLTKAVLKAYAEFKPDGSVWDAGGLIPTDPEADIFVRFSTTGWNTNTSTKNNIKVADLPFTWNLTQQNIYLSNQEWTVELRDEDTFGANSELMTEWTAVNPATAGENGVITLTNTVDGYTLELHYENRQ
jgi:PKD repeat protein